MIRTLEVRGNSFVGSTTYRKILTWRLALRDHAKLRKAKRRLASVPGSRPIRLVTRNRTAHRRGVQCFDTHLRAGRLRDYLVILASATYILSGLFALGLVVDFVWSLFKRDLSRWWIWPAGVVAVLVLMIIAWDLLRVADKNGYERSQPSGQRMSRLKLKGRKTLLSALGL